MQMLHVFHEIHNGGLGSRIQGQDGIDDVLGGVVQGHIAAQDFRRNIGCVKRYFIIRRIF